MGTCVKGRWVLPNGVFFEGNFENNKPKGQGKWRFPDTNVCQGTYEQKEKEEGEADEEEEEEKKKEEEKVDEEDEEDKDQDQPDDDEPQDENPEEKKKFKLIWRSSANLLSSASQIKEIQALE